MARTDPQVNFRIPADLLEQIKTAADTNNRTITAELVSRLEASFDDSRLTMDQVEKVMAAFAKNFTSPPKLPEGMQGSLLTGKTKKPKE